MEKTIKSKVSSSIGAPHIKRFFHNFNVYRVLQFTTQNIAGMKEAKIGQTGTDLCHSDLQPHAVHRLNGDKDRSLIVAVPRHSLHFKNLQESSTVSCMCGHTDPQLMHWFKEGLKVLPPRSLIQGKVDLLSESQTDEIWTDTFLRHPKMHEVAEKLWKENSSKTPEEVEAVEKRLQEEDQRRMKRMSDNDWLGKSRNREQDPTPEEDEEKPVYVMKPSAFQLIRVRTDTMLWASYAGPMKRVWPEHVKDGEGWPERIGVQRSHQRLLKLLNMSREKLCSSLNMAYNMKLLNIFCYDLDDDGVWAMGCQENFGGEGTDPQQRKENWHEMFFEYGKGQKISNEMDFEWWVRGLLQQGGLDAPTNDLDTSSNIENARMHYANHFERSDAPQTDSQRKKED